MVQGITCTISKSYSFHLDNKYAMSLFFKYINILVTKALHRKKLGKYLVIKFIGLSIELKIIDFYGVELN